MSGQFSVFYAVGSVREFSEIISSHRLTYLVTSILLTILVFRHSSVNPRVLK